MSSLFDILPPELIIELATHLPYDKLKFIINEFLTKQQLLTYKQYILLKYLQNQFPKIYHNIIEHNVYIWNNKHTDNHVNLDQLIQTLLELQRLREEWVLDVYSVDPSNNSNQFLRLASDYGHVEVIKLLLSDERVDPTYLENGAIRIASDRFRMKVVKLLLSDRRVKNSLSSRDYNIYLKMLPIKDQYDLTVLWKTIWGAT